MASEYLDRARELRLLIDENAAKTDGLPIPQETINALVDAELHKVMVPEAVGGSRDSHQRLHRHLGRDFSG